MREASGQTGRQSIGYTQPMTQSESHDCPVDEEKDQRAAGRVCGIGCRRGGRPSRWTVDDEDYEEETGRPPLLMRREKEKQKRERKKREKEGEVKPGLADSLAGWRVEGCCCNGQRT